MSLFLSHKPDEFQRTICALAKIRKIYFPQVMNPIYGTLRDGLGYGSIARVRLWRVLRAYRRFVAEPLSPSRVA